MFKIKLALIVAVGLCVHTPRDWSHKYPIRPPETQRLTNADLFTLRVAVKLAGRKSALRQAALAGAKAPAAAAESSTMTE